MNFAQGNFVPEQEQSRAGIIKYIKDVFECVNSVFKWVFGTSYFENVKIGYKNIIKNKWYLSTSRF